MCNMLAFEYITGGTFFASRIQTCYFPMCGFPDPVVRIVASESAPPYIIPVGQGARSGD